MRRRSFHRRALSLTPLVDVIFLLLLFFMLTSTFSRYAEIEVSSATAGAGEPGAATTRFLQLGTAGVRLAGRPVPMETLARELAGEPAGARVLVSLGEGVEAQRLIDLLGLLRAVPGLSTTVLR